MHMIEENRGAHAPRVFRATSASVGFCDGDVVSGRADHCTRGRVRSPFYTLGLLITAEAAGQDAVPKSLRPASLRRSLRSRNHDQITSGIGAAMKTLDRQKLNVVNKTRSNPALRDWRGQFTPEFVEHPTRRCLQISVSMHHATW